MENVGRIGGGRGPIDDGGEELEGAKHGAEAAAEPAMPRSGWKDRDAFGAAAARAKAALDIVESKLTNWRAGHAHRHQPSPIQNQRPEPPRVQPMYGVIAPSPRPTPRPTPRPPIDIGPIRPMYGVIAPSPRPPGGVTPTPTPAPTPQPPPVVRPMYGVIAPTPRPPGGVTPTPTPHPGPIVRPMYGVIAPTPHPAPSPIDIGRILPMYGVVAPFPRRGDIP